MKHKQEKRRADFKFSTPRLFLPGGIFEFTRASLFPNFEFEKKERKSTLAQWFKTLEIGMFELDHTLVHSLVRSHRSRAPLPSFVRSLICSQVRGTVKYFCPIFKVPWITVARIFTDEPVSSCLSHDILFSGWKSFFQVCFSLNSFPNVMNELFISFNFSSLRKQRVALESCSVGQTS